MIESEMVQRRADISRATALDGATVVIPQAAGVGNAILFTPVIRQLVRAGVARIVIIARGDAIADVFRMVDGVAQIHVTGHGKRGFLDFIRHARRERADLYLVPYPSNRWQYSVLSRLSGARRVVTHCYPVGGWRALHFLIRSRVPAEAGLHDVVQNLRLLRELGIEPDETESPRLMPDEAAHRRAAELLREIGIDGQAFVVMHAGSGATVFGAQKRWPAQKFAALADRIVDELGLDVVVVEGPDERGVGEAVASLARHRETSGPRVRSLPLRGALSVSAAVCAASTFYVGNDAAIAHLAAAVGKRTVTIFGPTDPITCAPFGNDGLVVRLEKACAPCFSYPLRTPYPHVSCRHAPYCIEAIEVDAVMSAVVRARSAVASTRKMAGFDAASA